MKLILFFLLLLSVANAEINFDVTVNKTNVAPHENIKLSVVGCWNQDTGNYVIYNPIFPNLEGLEIVDHIYFSESIVKPEGNFRQIFHQYEFSLNNSSNLTFDTGAFSVKYKLKDEVVQHTKNFNSIEFNLIKGHIVLKIIFGLLALILLMLIVLILISRITKTPKNNIVNLDGTLETKCLAELELLRKKIIAGDTIEYYSLTEELIRNYFRSKYQIGSIEEWQPQDDTGAGLNMRVKNKVDEILRLSHRVRYASYTPNSHDNKHIHKFIKNILTKNQPRLAKEELYLN